MSGKRAGRPASQLELGLDGTDLPMRGLLYTDVNRQIAALIDAGKLDRELEAGSIQQARQLAAAIDRASGLGGRKQETYALPQLHRELRELLAILAGRQAGSSALTELVDALTQADVTGAPDDDDDDQLTELVDPPSPRVMTDAASVCLGGH